MTQNSVITTLINLAGEQILKIERELAKNASLKILEEKNIKELQEAAIVFSQQLNKKLFIGSSMKDYQAQNLILNNFYLNIEQSQQKLQKLNDEHSSLLNNWQDYYKRNMKFNTLVKRQDEIDLIINNKREQKNLDEHSIRSYLDKPKKYY